MDAPLVTLPDMRKAGFYIIQNLRCSVNLNKALRALLKLVLLRVTEQQRLRNLDGHGEQISWEEPQPTLGPLGGSNIAWLRDRGLPGHGSAVTAGFTGRWRRRLDGPQARKLTAS